MIPQSLIPYLCQNSSDESASVVLYIPPKYQKSTQQNVVVSIIGQQFTDQTISYLVQYFQGSTSTEPRLGSILLDLILCREKRPYGVFVLLVHPSVKTSNLDHISEHSQFRIPDFLIHKISLNQISCVYTINSHFQPCHKLISEFKYLRQIYNSHIPIIELQHGWVVNKLSCLREEEKNNFNPDIYLVMDKLSQAYLQGAFPYVKAILVGDVLFSKQIEAYSNSELHEQPTASDLDLDSKKVLVCFSEKDIYIGYVSGKLLKISGVWIPVEIKSFLSFLATNFSSLSLSIRSKPHQEKKDLHKYFDYKKNQPSLISSLIRSDFVVSALSTVSISASHCGIPSAFYIANPKVTHRYMIKAYSKKVFYINAEANDEGYKNFFGYDIEDKFQWLRLDHNQRLAHLIRYAESAILNFNNHLDSILR